MPTVMTYMEKFPDFDWQRASQFIPNGAEGWNWVQKIVIECRKLKLSAEIEIECCKSWWHTWKNFSILIGRGQVNLSQTVRKVEIECRKLIKGKKLKLNWLTRKQRKRNQMKWRTEGKVTTSRVWRRTLRDKNTQQSTNNEQNKSVKSPASENRCDKEVDECEPEALTMVSASRIDSFRRDKVLIESWSKDDFAFLSNHFSVIQTYYASKMCSKYPGI